MTLTLATLGNNVQIVAESDGLWLYSSDSASNLVSMDGWPKDSLTADAGRATAIEIEQLLEQGLAEPQSRHVRIPYACFAQLRRLDYRCTTRWTNWSPFLLSVAPIGDLGRQDFHYKYRFRLGASEVAVARQGYFVQREAHPAIYHLDDQTFALIEAMDRFNGLPTEERTDRENWVTFALIKECASSVGASLDRLLQVNEVVVPSRVGVRIVHHDDGSVSFVPRCESVSDEGLKNAFLARPNAEGVYSVDQTNGGRVRVVLDDEQQEVLARMKRLHRLSGEAKHEAVKDPARFFDGLLDRIDLPYGRRVEGVGAFPFALVPRGGTFRTGVFDGVEHPVSVESDPPTASAAVDDRPTSIRCNKAGGDGCVEVRFSNAAERLDFRQRIQEALSAGANSLRYGDVDVAIDTDLEAALSDWPAQGNEHRGGKYLLIYTDEEDLRAWDEEIIRRISSPTDGQQEADLPTSLDSESALKPHQAHGLRWLQHCTRLQPDRRGCLLADDMGLGKTLQVLTYLAWAIEQGRVTAPGGDMANGPWRPILIVAPLILVEAETWRSEMERFFRNNGAIFEPVKVVHGASVKEFRDSRSDREIDIGAPTLSAAKLMRYRVVITNYETVKNYQHSFAQVVDGTPIWSIVVTDEAQEYKTPNTKISHAVKALQPDFHIACTGTPVENRLLDVWNVMDAIQPALLGTARKFAAQYETAPSMDTPIALSSLRERLLFGEPNAFVMRRDKSALPDLPDKKIKRIYCDMTEHEIQLHRSLVAGLRGPNTGGKHLGVLHRLSALYQHPSLLDDTWVRKESRQLLEESSKLRHVVDQLSAIRDRGDKALVFARLVDMQQLLSAVLREEFQLRVHIINGTTPRNGKSTASTVRARQTRADMLHDFKSKPGFNVLILSPFVAGIGLTLTEANHVIHYGRWWNPAVESQATDRVFRIGQSKPVTVYLPILHDPQRLIESSFDECLDGMLQQKEVLAREFLQPMPEEDTLAQQLCSSLVGAEIDDASILDQQSVQRLSPGDFEALVACLYRHQGYEVVLTSQSSDGGADVIAVDKAEVILIQAKHSADANPVTAAALDDVLGAQSIYQSKVSRRLRLMVVTNAYFDAGCITRANKHGIKMINAGELLRMIQAAETTLGHIAALSSQRASSFADGLRRVRLAVDR